jgi:hypothetical protein
MTEYLVQRPIEALPLRDEYDGTSAGFQNGVDVAQCLTVISDVFQDVETDNGIHTRGLELFEIVRFLQVTFRCTNVRPLLKSSFYSP